MFKNDKDTELAEKMVDEYLDCLVDAEKQRDRVKFENAKNSANVVVEIAAILKKYNILELEETIDTLVSVVAMPIQLVEPDPLHRARLMGELASAFVTHIVNLQLKDQAIKGSERGKELDRLRDLNNKFFQSKKRK